MGKETPVICRPALPMDTTHVLELTRSIWEGEDYVPKVWADWLADPGGLLAAAECRGVVIGIGKLTKLSPQQWWLEGLRVHPEYEGLGIASRLNDYLLDFWLKTGTGIIRMATSSSREAVKHLAQKKGFHIVGEFSVFEATATSDHEKSGIKRLFSPLGNEDIKPAIEFIQDANRVWSPYHLLDLGWQWVTPQEPFLEDYVKDRQAWWWRDKKGVMIKVDKQEDQELWARVRLLACRAQDLRDCLRELRSFAGQSGYDRITWLAPLTKGYQEIVKETGFQRSWDGSLLIFEKSHPDFEVDPENLSINI
jgi:GNAT superfamily N-acetyltransferase